ncbi:MAG TPA: histidinol-phosphate transaminase [Polyangiales bacterium]|jgi:histidinol-phosphate/aromatic aminotransferase/cobyric acid decarboxylase-like protein|nr:histidinol-phosphate transaminase [Polyangiales bacterium]
MSRSDRTHGDLDRHELLAHGVHDPREIIDLSVNVNPFGTHPEVLRAAREAMLDSYPDRDAREARAAIASEQRVDLRSVVVGHGANELLWASIDAVAREAEGRPLLVVGPTFSEPEVAARARGLAVKHVALSAANDFAFEPSAVDASIREHAPCAVYLCQPNNPTGRCFASAELRALSEAHPGVQFLVDQSFLSLSTRHAEQHERFGERVVLIRSLTKDHALAGLRAAYALCHPDFAARLDGQRPLWTVSAPAQAAILAALAHPEHVVRAREALLATRAQLAAALATVGCHPVPSDTTFLLARAPNADAVRSHLLQAHRIVVRSCRSFGLPDYLRFAAPTPSDLPRVIEALRT